MVDSYGQKTSKAVAPYEMESLTSIAFAYYYFVQLFAIEKKCFEPSVQFHVMKCFTFLLWHLDQTQLHAEFALYYTTCPFSAILMKIRLLCRCETE